MKYLFIFLTYFGFISVIANDGIITFKSSFQEGIELKYADNPNLRGICFDIIQEINQIDPNIRFSGLNVKKSFMRILSDLKSGEIDVFFGVLKNSKRINDYYYLEPGIYEQKVVLAVRADDNVKVNSWDDVRQLMKNNHVLVSNGTAYVDYIKTIPGISYDDGQRDILTNLQKLSNKRARFYLQSDIALNYELLRSGQQAKFKILPWVIYTEKQYVAFNKNLDPQKIKRIEKALHTLEKKGRLQAILNKYRSPKFLYSDLIPQNVLYLSHIDTDF